MAGGINISTTSAQLTLDAGNKWQKLQTYFQWFQPTVWSYLFLFPVVFSQVSRPNELWFMFMTNARKCYLLVIWHSYWTTWTWSWKSLSDLWKQVRKTCEEWRVFQEPFWCPSWCSSFWRWILVAILQGNAWRCCVVKHVLKTGWPTGNWSNWQLPRAGFGYLMLHDESWWYMSIYW